MSDINILVFDNGSGFTKAGFAGENSPRSVFANIIGRSRNSGVINEQKSYYIGEEIELKQDILELKSPIEHGIITNWDDMQKIWEYTFYNELQIAPEENAILLTESSSIGPKSNREKMTQIMFEEFNVGALSILRQGPLGLFSYGLSEGLVVESGHGVSHAVSIYHGRSLPYAIQNLDISGRDVTNSLIMLLNQKQFNFHSHSEHEIVRDIKESLCFVSTKKPQTSPINTLQSSSSFQQTEEKETTKYELPDGQIISIGNERFCCTEILFGASVGVGVQHAAFNSIRRCDFEIQKILSENICLVGGTTMFPGFAERLKNELTELFPPTNKIEIKASPRRKYGVWLGGSILASLSFFLQDFLVPKELYEESGPSIIHSYYFL